MDFDTIIDLLSTFWYLIPIPFFILYCIFSQIKQKIDSYRKLKARLDSLTSLEKDLTRREKELKEQSHDLDTRAAFLSQCEKRLSSQENELSDTKRHIVLQQKNLNQKSAFISNQCNYMNDAVRKRVIDMAKSVASRDYLCKTPTFSALNSSNQDSHEFYSRLSSALTQSIKISSPFDMSAKIITENGEYETTLYSCTCPDYQFNKQPCKHMMKLALEVGFLIQYDTTQLEDKAGSLLLEYKTALSGIRKIKKREEAISKREKDFQALLTEKQQTFPWLAALYADLYKTYDDELAQYLRTKAHPAHKKADLIEKELNVELRDWRTKAKQYEYQLTFYQSLFPWLNEFEELPPQEAFETVCAASSIPASEQSNILRFLSPEEYSSLSPSQQSQLALDRYIKRHKSNWDIGIEYERYIGYLCEKHGYDVKYNGAIAHKEDMGRDLIVSKGNEVILVQCKRWSSTKTIHENHIFQLAGSVYEYEYAHPDLKVSGAFVTSTTLSPVAALCAERLQLSVFSEIPFSEYPRIKCNIGHDSCGNTTKIYHLPMDQQYDTVKINSPEKCYVSTVEEAENLGFRRAYAWSGSS